MKKVYKFVGGEFNGLCVDTNTALGLHEFGFGNGYTEDLSETRRRGGWVHRAELDNELKFEGYLSPMWDGYRYVTSDGLKYEFDCTEEEKQIYEKIYVLRYETQEVYDLLSH